MRDMYEKITILVNSCDYYKDAWEPFFRLLKIQWPKCENYRIVLNTESQVYNCDFLNVETICGGYGIPWAKRLKFVLSQITSEYIIYFLEDFFLMSPVSDESLSQAFELMERDKLIGYIGLKYNTTHEFKDKSKEDFTKPFLNKDDLVKMNRVNSMTALWRKNWLESLIRIHETPWEFEKYGSIRSRRTKEKVLIINNSVCSPVFDYQVDYKYGYGISEKKWLPKNKELFEKYQITVDFNNLGFIDEHTYQARIAFDKGEKKILQNTKASYSLKENLYVIKKIIVKFPKRMKKRIRKIQSLI